MRLPPSTRHRAGQGKDDHPRSSVRTRGLPNAHEDAIHGPKESLDVEHEILTFGPNLKLLVSILRRDNTMARFQGMSDADKLNDIQILNRALFFENRGVWAYGFAANKLSTSEVGKTVLELGLQNREDQDRKSVV